MTDTLHNGFFIQEHH